MNFKDNRRLINYLALNGETGQFHLILHLEHVSYELNDLWRKWCKVSERRYRKNLERNIHSAPDLEHW